MRFFMLSETSIFDAILVPTCLHFPSQNLPKSSQKSIPRCINFLMDFCIDVFSIWGSIWEANLEPCWPHFPPKWWSAVARRPLFCWGYVIFRSFGHPGPLLAPFWEGWGSIFRFFGRFGGRFWKVLGSSLEVSGDHLGPMCSAFLAKHFVY